MCCHRTHPDPLPRWGRGRLQRRAIVICVLQMRPAILGLVEDQRGWIGIGLAHFFATAPLAETLRVIGLRLVFMKVTSDFLFPLFLSEAVDGIWLSYTHPILGQIEHSSYFLLNPHESKLCHV